MAEDKQLQAFLDGASVSSDVFKLRPDYRAMLIAVDGIVTGPSDDISEALLQKAEAAARAELSQHPVTEVAHVAAWREAYKAFGTKPQKTRNSLEALMRRAEAGLPRVNRLTDVYNGISVKNQVPFGGEDLKKYSGSPRLIRATGNEPFETTASGETVVEHPNVGEVVWCDDVGVTCRHWNWRQTPRTALTDQTTSALFIMDALKPVTDEALNESAEELVAALKQSSPDITVASRMIRGPATQ